MHTKMVVFDIAGTTVKDKGNIAETFQQAFLEYDIEVTVEEVNKVMGWRKIDAVKSLLELYRPGATTDHAGLVEKIHDGFTRNMVSFYENDKELAPLPFAEEVFSSLRKSGVKVCLNTGFTDIITQTILVRLGWGKGKMIDDFISSDQVEEGRPHTYMIKELMKRNGITESNAVVKVGDTEVDVMEGRAALCGKVIAVTTGAYTRAQLETYRPDFIIDSLSELIPLL